MEVKLDTELLKKAKFDRNSGRTFDALHGAIRKLDKYPSVAFVVSNQSEKRRLDRDVQIICEHYDLRLERTSDFYRIDGKYLWIVNAHSSGVWGVRSYFILDHSCRESLTKEQWDDLLGNIFQAHTGETWPPQGA